MTDINIFVIHNNEAKAVSDSVTKDERWVGMFAGKMRDDTRTGQVYGKVVFGTHC